MKKFAFVFYLVFLFSCKDENKKANQPIDDTTTTNNIPEIIEQQIKLVNKDSNNKESRLNLIESLDSANLFKEALSQIDKLIDKESQNQDYWLMRGRMCCKLKDTTAAIKSFVAATKIYPSPIAMLELANAFAETKNINTIKVCEDLKKMYPDGREDAHANFFIGKYYSNIKDLKNAYTYLDKSISQDFHLSEAYIEKGYLLFNEKKYIDALKVFQLLNTLNVKNADGYYWQAKCFEKLNDKNNAIENYNKALKLDNSIVEAIESLKRLVAK